MSSVSSRLRTLLSRKKTGVGMWLCSMLVLMALLLAACGGGSTQGSKHSILNIGAHVGGDFTKALSPYNPTANEGIKGMVYETLFYFNKIDGSSKPWLAESYKWSDDSKQLTFTLRDGVKWNDGKDFSADDVVFTFNMLKQYKAADSSGLWAGGYLDSVSSSDSKTVTITFKKAYPPLLWYIAGQTFIVPKHIFESAGDPTTYANENPVGTGPYKLKKFSAQLLIYDKNPSYWQADKVKVDELDYPSVKDNTTLQLKLAKGEIDWGSFFAPDLDSTFVAKDPAHNHYWMTPTDVFGLYLNLTKAPFNDVAVRQAISAALDRGQLSKQAESGYVEPASTTGLILPNNKDFLDPAYANAQTTANKDKAIQLLQNAGYKKGSDGNFTDKSGKAMSFDLTVVSGWTDWEQMCQVIKQNLKDIGINVNINAIQDTAYFDARNNGKYEMLIGGLFGGPTPYYLYNTHLNSANLSPNGFNWEKWNDKETDKLLNDYASTTDPAKQKEAIMGLQKIFAEKLPVVPLVNAAAWYEYSSKNFTGWPDKNNPYAVGAAYSAPDNLIVVLNLTPAA
ncbi:ABC transporter substrate-binding protein [Ktedonospora formicarum]|uniref:Peptide ABC transporter substrate-binding protein n=1 Tax=Ktedonospora formicarum TaxID=2778364 RepID=A0A8J3MP06_9CHLR|nr:ABC transporter substrate-binding protein [Ktedonospora formicarum]GHO43347.1 peptide ABC transporter substrate-binding protein [Ktedonospora formicarum]